MRQAGATTIAGIDAKTVTPSVGAVRPVLPSDVPGRKYDLAD